MPMTRELKKRFMGIDDRIEKLEKRKPVQRTNGEDISDIPDDTDTRLENIEAVLQMPGPKDGDVQILSAWRDIIESKLMNIEKVLVMPGPSGFLSGFANKVDQVFNEVKSRLTKLEQTPDSDLETKVRDLQTRDRHLTKEMNDNRPVLKKTVERLNTLETKPVAGALSQVTGKMAEEIREHELELYGVGGKETGNGLSNRIDRLKSQTALVFTLLLCLIIILFGISILT